MDGHTHIEKPRSNCHYMVFNMSAEERSKEQSKEYALAKSSSSLMQYMRDSDIEANIFGALSANNSESKQSIQAFMRHHDGSCKFAFKSTAPQVSNHNNATSRSCVWRVAMMSEHSRGEAGVNTRLSNPWHPLDVSCTAS
jgi:hypothetical protein